MILGHATILCNYDYATGLILAAKDSSSSLAKSSGQLIIACSKISKTRFHVLMAFVTHEVMFEITFAFGLESSHDTYSLFASFHGSIILKQIELAYM